MKTRSRLHHSTDALPANDRRAGLGAARGWQTRPWSLLRRGLALTLAWAWPAVGVAWPTVVHQQAAVRALEGRISQGPVTMPAQEDVVAFYIWLGRALAGANEPDPGGRERFFARFPTQESFDAIGVRRLLALTDDPDVTVHGVDGFDQSREIDRFDVLAFAAGRHHQDHRFRNRVMRDGAYEPLRLRDGSPIPHDPASLHYGPQLGVGSDNWAMATLPAAATATDEALLLSEPWRFVAPVSEGQEVLALAGQVAQFHLDMAILAQAWAGIELKPVGEYFALVYGGVALGLLLDAASPFAAVQSGSAGLWRAAGRAYWRRVIETGGGVFAVLPSQAWLAARIRHNLRAIGEHLVGVAITRALDAGEAAEPSDASLLRALGEGAPAYSSDLRRRAEVFVREDGKPEPWQGGVGLASVAAVALADAATADASRAYDLMTTIVAPRWQSGDELVDPEALEAGKYDEAALLASPTDPATELARRELMQIAQRALNRGTTTARAAWQVFGTGHGRSAVGRLRQGALIAWEARERRVAAFRAGEDPPLGAFGAVTLPWVAGLEIGAPIAALGLAFVLWRRRRRAGT